MKRVSLLLIVFGLALLAGPTGAAQPDIDCAAPLEIWQIQGAGATANCLDQTVTTTPNVITATGARGFFIQASAGDGDPTTSDGIYVFIDRAPLLWGIEAGQLVTVEGRVTEFFDLTELVVRRRSAITRVDEQSHPLPEPVDLHTVDLTMGAVHPLERYEGMRVRVEEAFVTAPTNQFDEFGIALTGERIFREPGIEPDVMPQFAGLGLPEWDLNAELIEVDPPEMGLDPIQVTPFSEVSAVGVLAYSFRDYQLWPVELEISPSPPLLRPVRERGAGEYTVATLNVENLFDTVDDPDRDDATFENYVPADEAEYDLKLDRLAAYISEVLRGPDILALQEVENTRTLTDLALRLHGLDPALRYAGCLLEGNEGRGIDVAYLVRAERVLVYDCYRLPGSLDAPLNRTEPLFTRPPLVLDAAFNLEGAAFPLTLVNLHIKSLGGVETNEVQMRRLRQAEMVARYVQSLQAADPDVHIIVLGDVNAFQFSDGLVDVAGIIAGTAGQDDARLAPYFDLVQPNLTNQVLNVPAEDRYSYIFNSNLQVLDHILTSAALDLFVSDVMFGRGNADAPRAWTEDDVDRGPIGASDHDGLVLYIDPE